MYIYIYIYILTLACLYKECASTVPKQETLNLLTPIRYMCMFIYIYIYFTLLYTTYMHTCVHPSIHPSIHACNLANVHTTSVHANNHISKQTYIIHTYIPTYMHAYTHTHTCAHAYHPEPKTIFGGLARYQVQHLARAQRIEES